MTTRRELLRLVGATAGAGAVLTITGCRRTAGEQGTAGTNSATGDVLVVETAGGALAAVDAATGKLLVTPAPGVLSGDNRRLVRADRAAAGAITRLTSHRLPDGAVVSGGSVTGDLAVRVTSSDGGLVALATDAGPGHDPYRPGPRERTTIVVMDSAGQRHRLELPGNLEPEAFDDTGSALFVLDYLPPTAPDRYRVRLVDLASGELQPLVTRTKSVIPPGAEEEMRGEGRQAVYDQRRRRLFTLYTHQPEHVHTRDRVAGARRDGPHVHAFVHTLSLTERWAYCVDLPAPFGERPGPGHTITADPGNGTLYVVDAGSGTMAVINADELVVSRTVRFEPPTGVSASTTAFATFAGPKILLVAAGREVVAVPALAGEGTVGRWSVPAEVRGLAHSADGSVVYVGQPDALLVADPDTGAVRRRIDVPGLTGLRRAVTDG
ncbi:hypothetical protein [Plantactinospora sp. B5E13]|uniref:YncE family protein n=1 Tax=unclassified Plantactinospora TaxID=2631981 RepID=UPI00325E4236